MGAFGQNSAEFGIRTHCSGKLELNTAKFRRPRPDLAQVRQRSACIPSMCMALVPGSWLSNMLTGQFKQAHATSASTHPGAFASAAARRPSRTVDKTLSGKRPSGVRKAGAATPGTRPTCPQRVQIARPGPSGRNTTSTHPGNPTTSTAPMGPQPWPRPTPEAGQAREGHARPPSNNPHTHTHTGGQQP